MTTSYWSKFARNRTSRRNVLKVTGAGAFSAAFLAACGSGDSPSPTGGTATTSPTGATGTGATGATGTTDNGLLSQREDSTSQAVPGGTLITTNPDDPPHFDPHILTLPGAMAVSLVYNKLLTVKPGVLEFSDGSIEGDMADRWEFSPDNLTLTLHIREDVGTPPDVPPTNGRNLDAEDVVFSWNRWAELGSNRQDLVNAVNPAAPIVSLEATDSQTVVIQLQEPVASILSGLSSQLQGQFFIMPREAETDYNPRNTAVGAGAYSMNEYVASSRMEFTRNPNSYDANSYPEKIQTPIITETAQVVAQLLAGNVHTHYTGLSPDLVLSVKQDQDRIGLYQTFMNNVGVTVFFGTRQAETAPFRDERMRQAFSMAIDRDLYLDTFANVARFQAEGLPVETAWNAGLAPSDYAGWWLDPQSSDFGENAKFYEHNLTEARALISAAGYPDGVDTLSQEAAGGNYGPLYAPQIEVIHGMVAEAGIRLTRNEYQVAEWNTGYRDSRGHFDGVGFRLTPVPAEPRDGAFALYNTAGSLNYGFDPNNMGSTSVEDVPGDPICDDLTARMRAEFDNDVAIGYAHELQRYLGGKQYFHRALGSATGFNVAWPAVRNFSIFNGLAWGYLFKRYWVDTTRAPFV